MREGQRNGIRLPVQQKDFMKRLERAKNRDRAESVKCELAREILRSEGLLHLRVTGWSMLPVIRPGDTLTIKYCDAEQIAVGDVVLFTRGSKLIAHRVISAMADQEQITTKGDSSPSPDAPIAATQLLGKVVDILRNGEGIAPRRSLSDNEGLTASIVRRLGLTSRILARLQAMYEGLWRPKALCKS